MGNTANRDAQAIKQAERAKRALNLRLSGASYAQIGKELGISGRGAHKIVKRAIARIPFEAAEEVRSLHLARLDAMLLPIMGPAGKGDAAARDGVLRILKRQAELLGLDEPKTMTQVHVLLEKEYAGLIELLKQELDDESYRRILAAIAARGGEERTAPPGPPAGGGDDRAGDQPRSLPE